MLIFSNDDAGLKARKYSDLSPVSNRHSKRTLADRTKSATSQQKSLYTGKSALSRTSKLSKISRTELKLLEKSSDRPLAGTLYYILYTVLYSACFLCAKYLYDRNPDLTPF